MSASTVPSPPPPSRPRARTRRSARRAAAGAGLLVVLLLAGLALATQGGAPSDVAGTPAPAPPTSPTLTSPHSDTPTRSPTMAPTPTPSPTPTLEPLEGPRPEGIDTIAEQVSALRGLRVREPVDARVVPRADLGARFAELARTEIDPETIAGDERLLVALRLIEPDVDLLEVIEAFYTEHVLGLYVSDEKILYVGADDVSLSPAQRVTAAHEVVHALQDQHWDLEALLDFDDAETDEALAALALVEGDATLAQEVWAARHLTPEERMQAREQPPGGGGEALGQAPRYVRDAILFPYREGPWFVQALVEQGGFAAVDEAFDRLPRSTAEILHPDRYLLGQGPVAVTVDGVPGDGWGEGRTYSFGEFDLAQLFVPLGEPAGDLAAGWAGGAVRHWQRGDDDAVALVVQFDTRDDAAAACDGVPQWYETVAEAVTAGGGVLQGDRDWMAWTCTDRDVRIGIAPDEATAGALGEG